MHAIDFSVQVHYVLKRNSKYMAFEGHKAFYSWCDVCNLEQGDGSEPAIMLMSAAVLRLRRNWSQPHFRKIPHQAQRNL